MNNSVVIKGNKYGIVVVLDETTPFEEIKQNLLEKFQSAAKFFDKANMAISFEGRNLSASEEKELLTIISENSDLNIVCVIDNDKMRESYFKKAVEEKVEELTSHMGQFYKGTLRSGQLLESDHSLIIFGDVNPGANVIAKGNVVILGSLKGTVYAGSNGNSEAFVFALDMAPIQIRIGDVIARSNETSSRPKSGESGTMVAFVDDNNIYIEKYDKDIMNEIRL